MRNWLSFPIPLAILLATSDIGRAATPPVATVAGANLPGGDPSAPGRGFSTLGNDWRGDCVAFDPLGSKPPIDAAHTEYEIKIFDTADDFESFINISASASMSYGIYSGDAAADYLKVINEHTFSNFIAGKVTVDLPAMDVSATGLSALGKNALSLGSAHFHRTCGNEFATSVVYGGEFVFMLEVTSRDHAEYEATKADLHASVGNFGSLSGQFAQSLQQITKKYTLNGTIIRNGLRENLPDLTPEALTEYAQQFPTKLTANNGIAMRPVRYGVREYPTVDPAAPTFTEATIFMDSLARQYMAADQIAGTISYWQVHPDEFFSTDRVHDILDALNNANQIRDMLRRTALRCADNTSSGCRLPPNLPHLDRSVIPDRLTWVILAVSDGRRVPLGVVPPNEVRRVRFRGLWSPSGGTTWWDKPEGAWWIHYISPDGTERTFQSPTNEVAHGRDRVEVHLQDDPYSDNFQNPTDPASAALY
jgi:hypothetical protein